MDAIGEQDPIAVWQQVTAEPETARDGAPRPRRALLAGAAAATLVAVGVAAGAALGQPATAHRAARPAATAPAALPPPAAAPEVTPTPTLPDAVAAAVVALRMAAPGDRYVDTTLPEHATEEGDITVVTLRAVVLDRAAGGWGAPRVARYGVAVHADGRVSAPWVLPAPPDVEPIAGDAVDDHRLRTAAVAAVQAAGYAAVDGVALSRAPGGLLIARTTGAAPGEPAPRAHEIWLTRDAAAVLGSRPDPHDQEAP